MKKNIGLFLVGLVVLGSIDAGRGKNGPRGKKKSVQSLLMRRKKRPESDMVGRFIASSSLLIESSVVMQLIKEDEQSLSPDQRRSPQELDCLQQVLESEPESPPQSRNYEKQLGWLRDILDGEQ